jgi:hypothetical protein
MTRLKLDVTYRQNVGFVSQGNHKITRSFVALSLEGLRRKVIVATALKRRPGEEIAVMLDLDEAARAEVERRALSQSTPAQP